MTTSTNATASTSLPAFLSSLTVNVVIGTVLLLVFLLARRRYPAFYAPRSRRVLGASGAPPLPASALAWVVPIVTMGRARFVQFGGTDGYMYARFLGMAGKLFGVMAVAAAVVLVPTNASGANSQAGLDFFSMANIGEDQDHLLWVHWGAVYAFTALTLYMARGVSLEYVTLRHNHLRRRGAQARTVLVRGLDPACTSNGDLFAGMDRLFPGKVAGVALCRDTAGVEAAFDARMGVLRKKERAVVALDAAQAKEPARAEDAALRPTHRRNPTCWCVGGEAVDSIRAYTRQLTQATDALVAARGGALPPNGAGFVTFTSQSTAQIAGQTALFVDSRTEVCPAPEPRDVLWRNLGVTAVSRAARSLVTATLVFFVVVFWSLPVSFAASLANLDAIAKNKGFHWLRPVADASPTATGLIQGYLPTVVMAVFLALLPIVFGKLTALEGVISLSTVQRGVTTKMYLFVIIDVFLVTTLAGSVFSSLHEISAHPASLVSLLATSLPTTATFFINFVLLQAFTWVPLQLARPVPLLLARLKVWLLAKTDRDRADVERDAIGAMNWGGVVPHSLLVFTLALVYSTINPIMLPVAACFFGLAYVVFRHQFIYVLDRPFETGGDLVWPTVLRRIIVALYIYQLTFVGIFGLHKAPLQATLLFPLPVLTTAAWWYLVAVYEKPGAVMPLEALAEGGAGGGGGGEPLPAGVDKAVELAATSPLITSPGMSIQASRGTFHEGDVEVGRLETVDGVPVSKTYEPRCMVDLPGEWDVSPLEAEGGVGDGVVGVGVGEVDVDVGLVGGRESPRDGRYSPPEL